MNREKILPQVMAIIATKKKPAIQRKKRLIFWLKRSKADMVHLTVVSPDIGSKRIADDLDPQSVRRGVLALKNQLLIILRVWR